MTVVSKAALAVELGISKARVSQYVKAGLPVRSDGRLDREAAVKWVADNHADRLNGRTGGVTRATSIARTVKAARKPTPEAALPYAGEEAREAVIALIQRSEAVVAFAVVAAGGSACLAYSAAGIARAELMSVAGEHLDAIGAPEVEPDDTLGTVEPTPLLPNWRALADLAGEPCRPEAWREADRALPYWTETDPPDPPHPWNGARP